MSSPSDGFVRTHPEIADALAEGRPVVGLETAVLILTFPLLEKILVTLDRPAGP